MPRAKIKAGIDLDARRYNQGVEGAKRKASELSGSWKKVGTAIVGAFGAQQAIRFGKNLVEDANRMGDLADQAGLTTDALQAFIATGKDLGIKEQPLVTALTKIRTQQQAALSGNEELQKKFAALGIGIGPLLTKTGDEFIDLFSRMVKETNNLNGVLRLTSEENGPRLFRVMKEVGEAGLAATVELQKSKGQIFTKDDIADVDEFGDAMARIGKSVQSKVLPAVSAIADMVDGQKESVQQAERENTELQKKTDQLKLQQTLFEKGRADKRKEGAEKEQTPERQFADLRRIGANMFNDVRRSQSLAEKSLAVQSSTLQVMREIDKKFGVNRGSTF